MGSVLGGGEVISLSGGLGAGKTTFVQGLAEGLGVKTHIISPTFILMRSYQIPKGNSSSEKKLFHVDLYRLEDNVEEEIKNLGITDLWGKNDAIFVIEWADRLINHDNISTFVHFKETGEESRKISITKKHP